MLPLLAEPTEEQLCLLDVIYQGRKLAGLPNFRRADNHGMERVGKPSRWPNFRYVESVLYQEHHLEARSVLAGCPVIRGPGGSYGWVWHQRPGQLSLQSSDEIVLTVAGMTNVEDASDEVEVFIDALTLMTEHERSFRPSPIEVEEAELSVGDFQRGLAHASGRWALNEIALAGLRDMLSREPATWHCHASFDDVWTITLSPFLRTYAEVITSRGYLERIGEVFAPPVQAPEPLYPSSLSLPEAIDYLNAVWRIHAGKPLLRIARAEAAAKLALDCANADELEARLSAFCGILGDLQLPESQGNKKLTDLKDYVAEKLAAETVGRAETAVDDLRAFLDIRAWRQHPGGRANEQGRKGMQRLGVELPTSDWQGAWEHLQARAVVALSVLREEVDAIV